MLVTYTVANAYFSHYTSEVVKCLSGNEVNGAMKAQRDAEQVEVERLMAVDIIP
jgi:hypothetical protein